MTRSGPMLALAPGTRKAPGTGANTGPHLHPELGDERMFAGLHYAGYDAWLDHIWPAAACTRPIRLRGDIKHIDAATGELLRTIPTIGMPDWSIYKACGNRRATTCPGCAETYRRDAYHIIRAGLIGGKGVTPDVAGHPAVFVTFTAPSFGPVHARPIRQHTCTDKARCSCRPQPCHARRDPDRCQHGRHDTCFTRHRPGDPKLGQPLCPDCYDYAAHVVWNNQAGELWRRTKQAIERHLGQLARRRGVPPIRVPCGDGKYRLVDPVRVAHGKAAEYQARGAVHFHALLRLDGYDPYHPDQLLPPPSVLTIADLDDAIRWAAQAISYSTPDHPARPGGWTITWGTEIDIRVITLAGTGDVTDLAVASYLAKYSTKGTEVTGHASARITPDTLDLYANPDGTHPERLIAACWKIGAAARLHQPAPLGAHARLRRPLPHQSPPLLRPVRRPAPGPHHLPARPGPRPRTRTHPHRRPHRRRNHPHRRHLQLRRNRLENQRRRPARQHRRRPGPQTPPSRTRPARRRIRREHD